MRLKIFLLFFLSFSLASAIPEIIFQNEEIITGETVIGTIETVGEFTKQIEKSDISFYEGRRKTVFEFNIVQHEGVHYFYFNANRPGVYTLEAQNVMFKEANIPGMTTLTKEFEIKGPEENKSNQGILQIRPGYSYLQTNPKISIVNVGKENLEVSYLEEKISLRPNQLKEILITPNETLEFLSISSYKNYKIPIISSIIQNQSKPPFQKDPELKTLPENITIKAVSENKTEFTLTLVNLGFENITNMKINSTIEDLKFTSISSLEARNEKNLTFEFETKKEGILSGEIIIQYFQFNENFSVIVPVILQVYPKGINPENLTESPETCADLNGKVCSITEKCDGSATFTKNMEYCCFGNCIQESGGSKESSSGWIWGLLIIGGLGAGAYFFFNKYKKTKPDTPDQSIQKITEQHSKRLSGSIQRN